MTTREPAEHDRPWLASYAEGVPADVDVPEVSLPVIFERAVRHHARRPAMDFFGAATSYRELGDQVARAAGALHAVGVRAGDRVALVLPNCPQHVVAFYAVLRLGAVVVEHNPLYTAEELERQLVDHGATVAVSWGPGAETLRALGERVPVRTIIAVDVARALPLSRRLALRAPVPAARAARAQLRARPRPGILDWDRLVRDAAPLPSTVPVPDVHDVALLQYTGGTTGIPKGAVLTHRNLLANTSQGRAWVPGLRDGEETVLAVLPFFHAFGLTLCLTFSISIGARLVLLPRFDVGQALAAVRRCPPTFVPAVPPVYRKLAEAARRRGVDLGSVRYGISGAMSLPPEVVRDWEQATGGWLIEGYGLTETSPVALGNPASGSRRPGTVGVPFPSTWIRVVDPEDPAHEVPAGEPGELLVRGPQVFSGYWNRPEETAAALLPGGWLRTGDVVTVDTDGFVRIVDRIKELIITGGFNVYPSEVEDVLRRHPDVADVAVLGLDAAHGAEEVVAAVVPRDGAPGEPAGEQGEGRNGPVELAAAFAERLRSHCRQHLAGYKVPRRIVLVADLPRSALGKVSRRDLRRQLGGQTVTGTAAGIAPTAGT